MDRNEEKLFAALDRELPVQFGFNAHGTGGCSRPVSLPLGQHAMFRFASTILLLTVCGCAHTTPPLTLAHDIRVPKEWRAGATLPVSFISGTSEIERYISAYDRGWWWCVVHHARNSVFQPGCSDYFISGWAAETYGWPAGVGDAQARIEQLIQVYGKQRVSDLLSEFKDMKLDDE